jgi:hypothetical protein
MKPDPRYRVRSHRIVIAAANGFLGRGLKEWFSAKGDEMVAGIWSRR